MPARRLAPALLAALALACGSASQVTPPSLALSATTLSFAGTAGGAAPAAQQVTVTNAGGGTLSAPVATAAASWLTATVSGDAAPYTVTLQPSLTGLTAADYETTVQVASGSAANSPLTITVRLSVAPAVVAPALALSATTVSFTGTAGGAAPAAQQVTVTNAGGGTLTTPVATPGASWLTATVSGDAAPYTVTLQPSLAGLAAADYETTVQVASASAANSPLTITVRLSVVTAALSLSASAVEFRAASPGDVTAPQVITAASSNAGVLAAPTATVSYAPGGPAGWLTVTVSGAAAPYTLTFQADSTGLPGGVATATVEVASAGAAGSPVAVPVTLWIGRVVEVRHLVTFWQEDGSAVELVDPAVTEVALLQNDGNGGLARVVMQPGIAPGRWLALAVPGTYWAELVVQGGPRLLARAEVDLVDLGIDFAGRVPRASATAETLVTLVLDGLIGWLPGTDVLRLVSWGAQATAELSPAGDPGASPTVFDWATTMRTLLAPADELWIGHFRQGTPEGGGTTGVFDYLEAQGATSLSGVAMSSGAALELVPPAVQGATLATIKVDWRMEAMEAAAAPFLPAEAGFAHRVGLYAIPAPLAAPSPASVAAGTVIEATQLPSALSGFPDLVEPAVSIGRYLPAAWREFQEASFSVAVNRVAPGAVTPLAGTANAVRARAPATATLLAQPVVGAPLAPTLDGADALQAGLLTTATPTLAWTAPAAPAGAVPTSYAVELIELTAAGTATSGRTVASLVLPATSLQVPAGLLTPGKAYAARISARISPADAGGNTPLRQGMPDGFGSIWTQVFTVQ